MKAFPFSYIDYHYKLLTLFFKFLLLLIVLLPLCLLFKTDQFLESNQFILDKKVKIIWETVVVMKVKF